MDDLLIEDIDDDLVRQIEESAQKHGRTVNDEALYLLEIGLVREFAKRGLVPQSASLGRAQASDDDKK